MKKKISVLRSTPVDGSQPRALEGGSESGALQAAYAAGRDAGINGPNTTNCHFSIFSAPEKTAAWERGKASVLPVSEGMEPAMKKKISGEVLGSTPSEDSQPRASEGALELRHENQRLRMALCTIAEALKEPDGGSYWPARAFLDELDICHVDLNDLRVLHAVARAALAKARGGL